ncbi:hypothetical protein BH10BAC2_BH10BAC2_28450 [soil metagenome]
MLLFLPNIQVSDTTGDATKYNSSSAIINDYNHHHAHDCVHGKNGN